MGEWICQCVCVWACTYICRSFFSACLALLFLKRQVDRELIFALLRRVIFVRLALPVHVVILNVKTTECRCSIQCPWLENSLQWWSTRNIRTWPLKTICCCSAPSHPYMGGHHTPFISPFNSRISVLCSRERETYRQLTLHRVTDNTS